ncbi:MAG: hypothetical protein M3258_09075, partial [Thermoproteota archaeon]|nr:hypothetical protein [Thermoproteota archaeon]
TFFALFLKVHSLHGLVVNSRSLSKMIRRSQTRMSKKMGFRLRRRFYKSVIFAGVVEGSA